MIKKYNLAAIAFAMMTIMVLPLKANSNNATFENTWDAIFNKYNTNIYEALFSVQELRPYSIIQLDKTVAIYDNKWIAPETFAAMLDNQDRDILKAQVYDMIISLEPLQRNNIVDKVKYWCINDLQIHLLNSNYGFEKSEIMNTMYSMKLTGRILDKYNARGSIDASDLNEIEINEAYHNALNILISVNLQEQMKYHSQLMNNLAEKLK